MPDETNDFPLPNGATKRVAKFSASRQRGHSLPGKVYEIEQMLLQMVGELEVKRDSTGYPLYENAVREAVDTLIRKQLVLYDREQAWQRRFVVAAVLFSLGAAILASAVVFFR